ncbi:ankyrin repeat-containing domain, PGG domain protein [Tanacetum coccineum]
MMAYVLKAFLAAGAFNYDTALHIAASAKSTKKAEKFMKNLVSLMTSKDLEIPNRSGNTAFILAAAGGNVGIAMILLENNPELVNISGTQGLMPLYIACLYGKYEMVKYLYVKSNFMNGESWNPTNRGWVLEKCVEADFFDVALEMVMDNPPLAINGNVLRILARKTDSFKAIKPHPVWRIISRSGSLTPYIFTYSRVSDFVYSFLFGLLVSVFAVIHVNIGHVEKESHAMQLLKIIWNEIVQMPKCEVDDIIIGPPDAELQDVAPTIRIGPADKAPQDVASTVRIGPPNTTPQDVVSTVRKYYSSRVVFIAAEMGNTKFIVELIRQYPDLIWKVNDKNQSMFHVAVIHRQECIYNLLYEIGSLKDLITPLTDVDGNNMLHLAGLSAKNKRLQDISGVALQMQRELLWYKEVEVMVPPSYREKKNNDDLLPHELFTKEHKDLLSASEKWMKDTASQSRVVAVGLIVYIPGHGSVAYGSRVSSIACEHYECCMELEKSSQFRGHVGSPQLDQEASKKQESQQEERESKQEITASGTNDKQESTSKLASKEGVISQLLHVNIDRVCRMMVGAKLKSLILRESRYQDTQMTNSVPSNKEDHIPLYPVSRVL